MYSTRVSNYSVRRSTFVQKQVIQKKSGTRVATRVERVGKLPWVSWPKRWRRAAVKTVTEYQCALFFALFLQPKLWRDSQVRRRFAELICRQSKLRFWVFVWCLFVSVSLFLFCCCLWFRCLSVCLLNCWSIDLLIYWWISYLKEWFI